MSETPLEKFLARVRHRPSGEGFMAHCPTARHPNGDRTASLKVDEGQEKQLLLSCKSQQCSPKEIMTAVGLTERDMFADDQRHRANGHAKKPTKPAKIYPTAEDAANALQYMMLQRQEITGPRTRLDEYLDVGGKPVGVVLRFPNGVDPEGKPGKTFRQISPVDGGWVIKGPGRKWPLFRLNLLRQDEPVILVEGEKCADAAAGIGLNATTSAGGANGTGNTDWTTLRGREVWLLPDIGRPGDTWTASLVRILRALNCTVKIVRLPGIQDDGDDIVEFIEIRREDGKDDDAIKQEIEALAQLAKPVEEGDQLFREAAEPAGLPDFSYKFKPIDSKTLKSRSAKPEWLVRRMLVRGQPAIAGGPKKALKTSVIIDLAISLGTGTDFLGHFSVPRAMRVALLSGESGQWTIRETALRVCESKCRDLEEADVLWAEDLPQLSNIVDLAELRDGVLKHQVEVLMLDPAYLCLLNSGSKEQASNLFDIGPLLRGMAKACLDVGCTPILIHHARKNLATAFEPLELEDLSHAGFQEFARQWLLINRRQAYRPGSGAHHLWLSAGGSVGFSSLFAVDVDEGQLTDDFEGRKWDVRITGAAESISTEKQNQAQKKGDAQLEKEKADDARLLKVLDTMDPRGEGASRNKVKGACSFNPNRMDACMYRLDTRDKIIEEFDKELPIGSGAMKLGKAIRRRRDPALFENDHHPRPERTDV